MRISEMLRLVWINMNQNRFKTIMTSIGIVVGAATIVMVIAIGRGGQMDVAEQFSSLNAGAIDVSYEYEGEETSSGGFSIGGFIQNMFGDGNSGRGAGGSGNGNGGGGQMPSGDSGGGGQMPNGDFGEGGQMPGGDSESGSRMPDGDAGSTDPQSSDQNAEGTAEDTDHSAVEEETAEADIDDAEAENAQSADDEDADAEADDAEDEVLQSRLNQENIILTDEDVEDILLYVPGISEATISYITKASVEGGLLTGSDTFTIAGVMENYASLSNLSLKAGEFITDAEGEAGSRICVLGSDVAAQLFDSADEAAGSTIYIDDRTYTVVGVLSGTQTVSAGISPDDAILIPYETGIKYITGKDISPTITVIAEDVSNVSAVEADIQEVLSYTYDNAEFTFSDAGSKMEAAESSNRILTVLLTAMAAIVFIVGGIGIMNVLFVSVKERTNEIGILKALGASRGTILFEFLTESAAISLVGGLLGVAVSFLITPIAEHYGVRVEANMQAYLTALGFALLTGTIFGFYPAWKASKLVPVEALQAE